MIFIFHDILKQVSGQGEVNGGIEVSVDNGFSEGDGGTNSLDDQSDTSSSPLSSIGTITGMNDYIGSIIFSIITISIAVAIYFLSRYFINRYATSLNLEKRQLKGINSILKMIIIVTTVIIIIFHFSSLSGAAAGAISVAVGTIIGFSSRNTISNAIAGILLLSAKPFKIGDRIRTTEDESLIGDVVEITLLYTKIKTIRNELVAIPNQTLLQRQIVNYSGLDILSITINVTTTYNHNRRLIEKLLIDAATETEGIVTSDTNPSRILIETRTLPDNTVTNPFVMLVKFGEYGAIYDLRAYTDKPREFLKIASEIRKKIYDSFQKHGMDLTVPQAQVDKGDKVNKKLNEHR